jgi:iron-sulfur cluster repair protein YtfE (RIC family)
VTDCQDMIIIHRVFRRELSMAPALIASVADLDSSRSRIVGGHVLDVLQVLHHHHEGEDLLLWPKLRERAPDQQAILDEMEAGHIQLGAALDQLTASLAAFTATASASEGAGLAASLASVRPELTAHLDQEEQLILPLVSAFLSAQEWGALGQRAFSLLPPDKAMIVLGQMAEESPAPEWAAFMTHLPVPVQQAFSETGAQSYREYIEAVRLA